ncbi:MAG: DNA repair protein RecO [Coriobacteriaceae bacterium]|nr:DNA repair protein RecO [Coriobacteriaceae bacterium]
MAAPRTYRSRCIVLGKTKLKETDLIVTLLAEDGRQVRAVAKGARKPGSRLAARCEVCSTVDLLLARGRALDVVSQAELIAAPLGAAPSFELLSAGAAIVEAASLGCFEDASDPFVYPLTERALAVLGKVGEGAALDLIVAAYIMKLLSHIGYRPDLTSCVACGDEAVTYFSAAAGGLLCASCAASVAGAEEIDANEARWLAALIGLRFDELAATAIDARTATLLLAHAHVWAATHLDARLRALEFLLGH